MKRSNGRAIIEESSKSETDQITGIQIKRKHRKTRTNAYDNEGITGKILKQDDADEGEQ